MATLAFNELSNGDNKINLISLFVKFLKSLESEEFRKYNVWYVIIYIRVYLHSKI